MNLNFSKISPTFSIVTIILNDKQHILETINSVVSQTNKNIEYILIDGNSTDGTKEVILDYLHANTTITKSEINESKTYIEANSVQFPTLSFKFLSQSDKGIYDAMNKGIALASKEWINFMNCGDTFYNSQVLENIARYEIQDYDVIYGDTEINYDCAKRVIIAKSDPENLHLMFQSYCHQSFFIKTKLHQKYLFDLQFKIASDYNTILFLYTQGYKFKKLPLIIASFSSGGANDTAGLKCTQEVFKVSLKNSQNLTKTLIIISFYYPILSLKRIFKLYMPNFIVTYLLRLIGKTK